jgi:hypothetical protein
LLEKREDAEKVTPKLPFEIFLKSATLELSITVGVAGVVTPRYPHASHMGRETGVEV